MNWSGRKREQVLELGVVDALQWVASHRSELERAATVVVDAEVDVAEREGRGLAAQPAQGLIRCGRT